VSAPPPSLTFNLTLARPDEGEVGRIPLPCDPRAAFGRANAPVVVRIAGHSFRSTVANRGGGAFVPFARARREAAGVVPGGTYLVTLTLDTAPRDVALPGALAAALDRAGARAGWDRLSVTRRRELAEGVAAAKRPDTRERRIAAALTAAAAAAR
jgi:hypothetical protein